MSDTSRIYVGNLPFTATEEEVRSIFSPYGRVVSVALISDRETGRPRGFGFVEMNISGAEAALEGLESPSLGGRALRVNEARQRAPRRRGWFHGGGGRGPGGWGSGGDRRGW